MIDYLGKNVIRKDVELMFRRPTPGAFYTKAVPIRDFVLHYSDFGLDVKRLSWSKKMTLVGVRYGFVIFYWYLFLYAFRVVASCVREMKRVFSDDKELVYDYLVKPSPLGAGKRIAFKTVGLLVRMFDHTCLLLALLFNDLSYLKFWQIIEGINLALQYLIYILNVFKGNKSMIAPAKFIGTVFRTYVYLFAFLMGFYFDNTYLTESFTTRSRGVWF